MDAKFTSGRPMRHVAVMTATSGVGLVSLFLVDALNLFYISMLGEKELAAAIGFAGTVQFFTVSVSIGLSIAATAVVSRAVGAGQNAEARELATSAVIVLLVLLGLLTAGVFIFRDAALGALGARGETLEIASRFLAMVLPSLPFLALGMISGGILRAIGEARRSMAITLTGGAVAASLDPILIFGLDLGVDGAAIATFASRLTLAGIGLHFVMRRHDLLGRADLKRLPGDARQILGIGAPAVATQLSTPFGNALLTATVATHGDAAVAGWAVVGRLTALAFGAIFALSGAVGPIIGQNRGAGLMGRVRETYRDALIFAGGYVLLAWAILFAATDGLIWAFGLTGAGATVLSAFTHYGAGAFLFTAALFVSNAAFNNLGKPVRSTLFNWSRDGIVIPLLAALIAGQTGAEGVVLIQALAALLVGTSAGIVAWRFVRHLDGRGPESAAAPPSEPVPAFASGKTAFGQLSVEDAPSPFADRRPTG